MATPFVAGDRVVVPEFDGLRSEKAKFGVCEVVSTRFTNTKSRYRAVLRSLATGKTVELDGSWLEEIK